MEVKQFLGPTMSISKCLILMILLVVDITEEADDDAHVNRGEYEIEEYTDMVELFILSHHNSVEAAEAYANHHPNRRHPSRNTFVRAYDRFRDTGNLEPRRGHYEHPIGDNYDVEEEILDIVTNERNIGIREVARRVAKPYSMVQNFLRFIGSFI